MMIVKDLCNHQHMYFYLWGNRTPCPYCAQARMKLEYDQNNNQATEGKEPLSAGD